MRFYYILFYLLLANFFYAQINLSAGLTGCYNLNGNAIDQANGFNGTLSAVTPTIDRANNAGGACYFNGNSYISLPNTTVLKSDILSFSCWIRLDTLLDSEVILFAAYNTCTGLHGNYMLSVSKLGPFGTYFQLEREISAGCSAPFATYVLSPSNIVPMSKTWYQIGFTCSHDSAKLYINGLIKGKEHFLLDQIMSSRLVFILALLQHRLFPCTELLTMQNFITAY